MNATMPSVLLLMAAMLSVAGAQAPVDDASRPPSSPRFLVPARDTAHPPSVIDPSRLEPMQRSLAGVAGGNSRLDVLRAIARETGLRFVYETAALRAGGPMAARHDTIPVASALRDLLRGTNLDVLFASDGVIVLVKSELRTQSIAGLVNTRERVPLANADVIVTMAPNRELFRTKTDLGGRYAVIVPDGTGDYLVYIGAVGYASFRRRITGTVRDSMFAVDATLAPAAPTLAAVRTVAQRVRPLRADDDATFRMVDGAANPVATLSGALAPDQLGDLIARAATTPGMQVTPDGRLSAFGLDDSQNRTFINGMPSEIGHLPRSLQTSASVLTNVYDPTQGGFAGAGILVRIHPGSTMPIRLSDVFLDVPPLQSGGALSRQTGQRVTGMSLSFSQSDELIQDLWVYNAALTVDRRTGTAPSLLSDGSLLLAPDSVSRFLALTSRARIPAQLASTSSTAALARVNGAFRIDRAQAYEFGGLQRDTKPRVGIVGVGEFSRGDQQGSVSTALPSHAGESTNGSGMLQLNYSRYFGEGQYILNEGAVGLSASRWSPYLALPESRVRVTSSLTGESSSITTLFGGGASNMNGSNTSWTWAANENVQWSPADHLTHRLKVAFETSLAGFDQTPSANVLGTYTFNSLADFDANRPAAFSRALFVPSSSSAEWTGAFAIVDYFAPTPALTLTFGPRVEANAFTTAPAYNGDVARVFGQRTDATPAAIHVSPRVGFRWIYLDQRKGGRLGGMSSSSTMGSMIGPPKGVLSGGVGEFRSSLSPLVLSSALAGSGLAGTSTQGVSCVGDAVPLPDWSAISASGANIPSACVTGSDEQFTDNAPSVRMIDHAFGPPRSWRGNVMWASGRERFFYSINATYSRNVAQGSLTDLNFAGTTHFTLSDETARPVFVPSSSIVAGNGALSATEGRRYSSYGSVLSQLSDLRSETRSITVNLAPYASDHLSKWNLAAWYTYTDTRTQSRGYGGTTAADPRSVEWSVGATPRHQLVTQGGYMFLYKARSYVSVTARSVVTSGFRYTPVVASDVNGDGLANDRAFVFDPARTPTSALASGLRDLLADASPAARECITTQLNTIAQQNSCHQPTTVDLNAGIDWNHQFGERGRGFHLSLNLQNPLAAIDELAHGVNGMHGWGTRALPDTRLYYVTGFDPGAQRYQYEVNPHFGDTRPRAIGVQNPFRITLIARLDITTATAEVRTMRLLRPTRNAPGLRPPADTILKRLRSTGSFPLDPLAAVLQFSDSLLLTSDQIVAIQQAQLRQRERSDSTFSATADYLAGLPSAFDVAAATEHTLQAQRGAFDTEGPLKALAGILTPLQLRLLPSDVRRMLSQIRGS
ncbi:MAG: hypothetical protein ABJE47_08760 [bacterium]